MSNFTCTEPGCDKPSRNKASAAMCKMHYHRWYRHGSTDMSAANLRTAVKTGKYRIVEMPDHPTAAPCGKAYEHRVVLYGSIGPGQHPCHWCSRPVTWDLPSTDPSGLQVDHLNNRRDDNRLENLVPSCGNCNAGRGAKRRSEALRTQGFWSVNDTVSRLRDPKQRRVANLTSA